MKQLGQFRFRIEGIPYGNVLVRTRQYEQLRNRQLCLQLYKNIVKQKILCQKRLIASYGFNHPEAKDEMVKRSVFILNALSKRVSQETEIIKVEGMEGYAAKLYYNCFGTMVRSTALTFNFSGRTRRPPKDSVNALLSYGYSVLYEECVNALCAFSLDPYVGVFHGTRPGKKALALDLMEIYRTDRVDRLVLKLINRNQITSDCFQTDMTSGGVYLNSKGKKVFFSECEREKARKVSQNGMMVEQGILPYLPAQKMAKLIVEGESSC